MAPGHPATQDDRQKQKDLTGQAQGLGAGLLETAPASAGKRFC